MLKRILTKVRDSCYILLATRNGEKYAEKEHGFLFSLISGVYYVVLLTILAIFQFKAGIRVPEFFMHNAFTVLLGGIIMFSPYYIFSKLILKKLSAIPVQKHITPERVSKAKSLLLLVFMLGAVLVLLVPWALSIVFS